MGRAISRLALGRGGPRDLRLLADTLHQCEYIISSFAQNPSLKLADNIADALDKISLTDKPELSALRRDIDKAFESHVPLLARDGGFIAQGWRAEIDTLKQLRDQSRRIIAGLQADYAQQTSVPNLKIKHNNVLGYFIEVTPKYADIILGLEAERGFIHRQTLASAVRFTTAKLAELDSQITGAADKILALELEIFAEFTQQASILSEPIREAARALARLDVQSAWAFWAEQNDAVRPEMRAQPCLDIEAGRHPVVEQALKQEGKAGFTANHCQLMGGQNIQAVKGHIDDNIDPNHDNLEDKNPIEPASGASRLILITGPNMAGKSTFLRQNALMFILAQAGGFVPARRAIIGIADRLFSRVGASDDLSKGRSTFMVEMLETAAILNQATDKSFVILDEIGRGTSTFDGLSLAWASAEHLHSVNQCRALFATHYHELTALIDSLEGAQNASLRAKDWNGDLVFLHDVKAGPADKSYGIQVAKLAGMPPAVIERAHQVLSELEADSGNKQPAIDALPLFAPQAAPSPAKPSALEIALETLDIDSLSARDALELLYEFKAKLQ